MGSELLNAVTYIKNISKKKVTFTKIEAFMRKKELLTCKDLDNIIEFYREWFDSSKGRWRNCSFPNWQRNQEFSNISIT